mmetsp:Transcript_92053/g.265675  ORF Transcript_92053/g.265675 Transcript_92053/m.265675 type:complete len:321 (+) Transcript_92053:146-1108(+)
MHGAIAVGVASDLRPSCGHGILACRRYNCAGGRKACERIADGPGIRSAEGGQADSLRAQGRRTPDVARHVGKSGKEGEDIGRAELRIGALAIGHCNVDEPTGLRQVGHCGARVDPTPPSVLALQPMSLGHRSRRRAGRALRPEAPKVCRHLLVGDVPLADQPACLERGDDALQQLGEAPHPEHDHGRTVSLDIRSRSALRGHTGNIPCGVPERLNHAEEIGGADTLGLASEVEIVAAIVDARHHRHARLVEVHEGSERVDRATRQAGRIRSRKRGDVERASGRARRFCGRWTRRRRPDLPGYASSSFGPQPRADTGLLQQ